MDMIIAAAHIVGSLVTLSVLGVAWWFVGAWETTRNARIQVEDAALELGISPDDQVDGDAQRRLRLWLASRYSSDLFRNRLSDLCGLVRAGWEVIGILSIATILCVTAWRTFSHSASDAVYAWLVVPAWLFFILTAAAFALLCKLLTGRYPGQARAARKVLAKDLRNPA